MKKFNIFALSALVAVLIAGLASCSETSDEVEEYADWQNVNATYFDKTYAEAKQKANAGDASCKVLRAYNIDEKVATHSYDHIVVNVLEAGNGSGCPIYTDSVKVHYSGRLLPSASYPNGKVFDQSWTGDYDLTTMMPVKFAVKGVVTGFSTALQYMHIGDRWQVIIPQQLAYGSSTTPGAAYSTLVFDVTLVAYYRANDVPKKVSRSDDGKTAEPTGCWIYE